VDYRTGKFDRLFQVFYKAIHTSNTALSDFSDYCLETTIIIDGSNMRQKGVKYSILFMKAGKKILKI
jgi:hypothetical protein